MDRQLAARRRVYLGVIMSNMERLLQTYDSEDDEVPILQEYYDYVTALAEECDQAQAE